MAKIKCSVVKQGHAKMAGPVTKAKAGDPAPTELVLLDTEKSGFTLFGVNAAGNRIDISGVASLTPPPVSSDTGVLTIGTVSGMHVDVVSVAAGTVTVEATATWNDGSTGPFVIEIAGTVKQDPNVTGLTFSVDTATPK
jgi:hypothetical protein